MVVDQGLSVAQVVKDMNIGRTAINRWIKQYRAEQLRQRPIKKSIGLLCPRTEMIDTLVDQEQQKTNMVQA